MTKSDASAGETPAKKSRRRSGTNQAFLNTVEWLIIALLTAIVVLLNYNGSMFIGN